jgi:hypothetical protein
MALDNKKYERIFSTTGSDSDKIDTAKFNRIKSKFDNNEYLEDEDSFETLGPVLYLLQKVTEEFDSVRDHVVNDVVGAQGPKGDKGDTGANGSNGSTGARGPAGSTGARGADGAAGGVYGNIIKILPTQFMGNDDVSGERTIIEDDVKGKLGVRVASSSQEIFTAVTIPEGKRVIGYGVYTNSKVTTYLNGVDLTTGVSSEIGTGLSGSVINLKTAYKSEEANYVAIKVMTTSTLQVIYGAVIIIADS